MTPMELIEMLITKVGPCGRICSYCPEELDTGKIKDCVEGLIRENYLLKQDREKLEEQNKYLAELLNLYRNKARLDNKAGGSNEVRNA